MRKLYNEFFYIPKHGKIREKVMLARVASIVAIMVACLVAMSITAYAYFSYNVTSGSNTIKAANFETDVTVRIIDADGKAVENSNITPLTSDNKNFTIEGLEVGKWYEVKVERTTNCTAQTGFIVVSAKGCEVTYHTQQLGVDKNVADGKTPEIRFKLMITDATNVILESHWGTSSYYPAYQIESENDGRYITLDEEIKMIVNGYVEPNVNKEGNEDTSEGTGEGSSDNDTNGASDTTITPPTNKTTTPSTDTTESAETTTPGTTVTSESINTTEENQ